MGEKATYEQLMRRIRDLEADTASAAPLKEQLQAANQALEERDRRIEEHFVKSNAWAMEAELARIELNQIFNTASDGIWIVDDQFTVIKINNALSLLLKMRNNDAIGRKCYDLFNGSLCRTVHCPMTRILQGEIGVECDIARTTEDAEHLFIATPTPFRGLDGKTIGMIENFKNITERKQIEAELQKANKELQRLTIIDGLTQVANRRRFDEYLALEWRRMAREKLPLSLIMCDVDCFKLYNDNYGHQSGDDCLRAVAGVIDGCAKRPADLAARYGGEEFAVILPNTSAEGAVTIAERIRTEMQNLMIVHAFSPVHNYVTLSLGVSSVVPQYKEYSQVLVEAADKALYEAKRSGRNKVLLIPPAASHDNKGRES